MSHPFMLVFLGRSGSTALMYDLAQHPKAIVHMEVFGEPALPDDRPQTDDNRIDFLHRMWAGYRNPEWMPPELRGCARGFKLQINNVRPQFGRLGRLARAVALNKAVVIALRRQDSLRQAVSAIRARHLAELSRDEGGLPDYHIKPESGPRVRAFAQEPTPVDLSELSQVLELIELNRRHMDQFLARAPPAVEVTYEEYLADRLSVLNRVLEALELEPFANAPRSDVAKITDDDLSKAVSNYDELRAFADARGLAL